MLWGSNARETHPIFFHHVLRGIRNGAKLYVVDPRRTSSARWADGWLGIDVGSDIALANAIGREILAAGLENPAFIARATSGFEAYRAAVEPYTLEYAQKTTGIAAELIAELARAYARAPRAILCWTLGITEHHNAVDNVRALINLALLCGHVGRYGSGLNPLRGQNNVQGGGDMGAIPNKFPGGQDVDDPASIEKFERAWGVALPRECGWNLTEIFHAVERGELDTLYIIGENPAQSEADQEHAIGLLRSLKHLIVQDIFLTKTGELAEVVFPATASWCESEGTVTSSERRVQRCRKALVPPGEARDDIAIMSELARRLNRDWPDYSAETAWDECRMLSPWHAGMSYRRLDELGGIPWPCYGEHHPGEPFLHARLWDEEAVLAERAPFAVVEHDPPVEALDEAYPLRLTTGRRLDSFNTGVQSGNYASPLRRSETLDLSPEDARSYDVRDGDRVRVTSRRGSIVVPAHIDPGLRPGLVFTTFHFNDAVATNLLTIDVTDPKSGTAEFKACAVRLEKVA